ncbi:unnamed protein product [Linum tenue]|uniref:Uncharacterized protein n=1 Tax=Linum tenue TaxID=586396 RepID=A0AAV0L7E1_9ROSI|nr:unnamed protein product [Linum tenue]
MGFLFLVQSCGRGSTMAASTSSLWTRTKITTSTTTRG